MQNITGVAPTGNPMAQKLKDKLESLGLTVRIFDGNDKIDEFVRDLDYGKDERLCFAVTFEDSGPNYKYNLRFNMTNNDLTDAPQTTLSLTTDQTINLDLYSNSIESGFIQMNTIVNNLILQ